MLAGFYSERINFAFPPAFMKEIKIRIAAEWSQSDLIAVRALVESGALSLDGLITHSRQLKRLIWPTERHSKQLIAAK